MTIKPIPLTSFRRHLGDSIDAIREGDHVIVSEFGHQIAAFIPISDYQRLMRNQNPTEQPTTGTGPQFSDGSN